MVDEEAAPIRVSSSSQVSSVGFNNLKKLNTNSSTSTNTSTNSSKPPNALTRLFTRNRSSSTVDDIILSDDEAGNDHENQPPAKLSLERKSSNVFRLTKMNKRKPKAKDLTVQTDLFKDQNHIPTRKTSVNSPVSTTFHNLFHRSNNQSSSATSHEIIEEPTPVIRSTITLSSNNSNSKIQDADIAKVYKFTDPTNSLEEEVDEVDNYKKIFLPADQFLKSKPPNSPTTSLLDSNINKGKDNNYEKFWSNLLGLIKPVILSSQQKRMMNGYKASLMIMTQEDISNLVKDNYTNNLILEDEESNDLKVREILQDLINFFNKVVTLFVKDFKFHGLTDDDYKNHWIKLYQLWLYFRNKIYFFLIDCFTSMNQNNLFLKSGIIIDDLLLESFKNVIIVPIMTKLHTQEPQEEEFLKSYKNGELLHTILQCFGIINSCQRYDDDNHNNGQYLSLVLWLTTINI